MHDTKLIQKIALALYKTDYCGTDYNWQRQLEILKVYDLGLSPEYGEAPYYINFAQ